MSPLKFTVSVCVPLVLLLLSGTAGAATLYVNCGGKIGLTSVSAALKVVQSAGPSTIKVSGACHENVAIQSMDRLVTRRGAPWMSSPSMTPGTWPSMDLLSTPARGMPSTVCIAGTSQCAASVAT
jgi:hypothetical protein